MSEDHTEKTVMPDIARHLLDTVPVSPLPLRIIDYNQPEWLAEFNRRGERIAELEKMAEVHKLANCLLEQERNELEAERDQLRKALWGLMQAVDGCLTPHEALLWKQCEEAMKRSGK